MLKLNNITVIFRGIHALNNFSTVANTGDFIPIVGLNAAGKSTLVKVIAGTITPDEGTIFIDDEDITQMPPHQRALFLSMLHQDPTQGSISTMTVEQNLALALYKGQRVNLSNCLDIVQDSALLHTFYELFPSKDILKEKVSNLSGGQRQLLAFVMATAIPPKVLLLDEPNAALDPAAAERMMTFVSQFVQKNKMVTLLITHDLEMALKHGNRLWIMKRGTLHQQFDTSQKAALTPHDLRTLL